MQTMLTPSQCLRQATNIRPALEDHEPGIRLLRQTVRNGEASRSSSKNMNSHGFTDATTVVWLA